MARFRARPLSQWPVNVLQFGPHAGKRRAGQRKTWWKKDWPYAALVAAPFVGAAAFALYKQSQLDMLGNSL